MLRHRRPVSTPFPNSYSHPLPQFCYIAATKQIIVNFACDPSYPPTVSKRNSTSWKSASYILSSIPLRKPRTFVDDASEFLTTGVSQAFSFLSGGPLSPKATPDEVFNGDIDLNDDQVLEHERGEEGEVDDSSEAGRKIRVLPLSSEALSALGPQTQARQQFEVTPLRAKKYVPRKSG